MKPMLLEYSEKQGFHYNFLDHISGINGFYAISLCDIEIASDFCATIKEQNLPLQEVLSKWAEYCEQHQYRFLDTDFK